MLHICKGTYLQAVKKCYILYKSATLRKLWNKKTILHKSQKNIEKEKKRILSLVIWPIYYIYFLNTQKQRRVIKNNTKTGNKRPYFLFNLIFFYIFAIDSLGQVMMKKSVGTI